MGRATEFIDFLTSDNVDDITYSHLEIRDEDGKIFKKGDFITFEPGSSHTSYTKNGCLVLVFMRGINEPSEKK